MPCQLCAGHFLKNRRFPDDKLKSKKTRMGIMLFLVPALVIYLVFQIIPIIGSIYFSLVDWNGIAGSAPKFVGLKN
mgnify:FL=1